MTGTPEVRTARFPVEFRKADGAVGTLAGYAAKFGRLSRNLGGFVERIEPGAFSKSLGDGVRVMCRWNHEDMALLGTSDAGTLRLSVDEVGLRYEADLPDTSYGRDVAVLAERGDLHHSSFAFHVVQDDWGLTEQDFPLRSLHSVHLVDVAPVNDPAYLDTSSGLRSFAEARGLDAAAVMAAAARNELRGMLEDRRGDAGDETPADGPVRPTVDELRAVLASRAVD